VEDDRRTPPLKGGRSCEPLEPLDPQTHRWLSMAFTLTVIANFVAMARGTPPAWVTYSPLLPLALLLSAGLYLFALPYVTKRASGPTERASRMMKKSEPQSGEAASALIDARIASWATGAARCSRGCAR
jgi:hypothetical protein